MRIGVPRGLFYYQYEPFLKGFFDTLNLEASYGGESGKSMLDLGVRHCVDEACLPMKLFHGQVKRLAETCDFVAVPRIMKTEYGESICPKFCGLPELVGSGSGEASKLVFTQPVFLDRRGSLRRMLLEGGKELGIPRKEVERAAAVGALAQGERTGGLDESGYRYKVFLAGHPYNVYDRFANLNLVAKLHRLDIGVITEERVGREEKEKELTALLKKPYWTFFVNIYGAAKALIRQRAIDGIICVSSFSCGTDSFTIEMLKNEVGIFPLLVLKIDEQTGEAGYDTRLEAFAMILESYRKGNFV